MKYHTPDVMDRLSPALTNDLGHENKEGYDKDNGKHKDQDANTNTNPLGTIKKEAQTQTREDQDENTDKGKDNGQVGKSEPIISE